MKITRKNRHHVEAYLGLLALGAQAAMQKTKEPEKVESFSDRYGVGADLDKWIEENNVKPCGMGYLAALHACGFVVCKSNETCEPQGSGKDKV
jgi:hypothetical protein